MKKKLIPLGFVSEHKIINQWSWVIYQKVFFFKETEIIPILLVSFQLLFSRVKMK